MTRPRVLILARANPLWTQYYIEAFRQRAEVLVVGPPLTDATRRRWFPSQTPPASVEPDISVDFDAAIDLRTAVPAEFAPDLVVGIAGLGGDPLPESVTDFACPTAYITVDTWQCLLNYPEARRYDYVFAAQREFVPRLRAVGARNVHWLPLACAPEHHRPLDSPPDADIAFAGSLTSDIHARRRALVEAISSRFNVAIQENAMGNEACQVYARGRLGLNHCAVDELNMRVFEVMAMNRPLLVNRGPARNGLLDLFEEDRHLIVYDDAEDLARKAARYLGDSDTLDRVAREGYAEVLARHTYVHRVDRILETVEPASQTSPWRDNARLADFLPHAPGRLLDIGMKLEASRYALRRQGATEVVGVSSDTRLRDTRKTSYDHMMSWPPTGEFDTVVLSDFEALRLPLPTVLSAIGPVMPAGAVLVMRLAGDDGATIPILNARGFHGILTKERVVVARRVTRTVREVVRETIAARVPPEL